ncbi:MAG: Ger(x)C family spore germination protein, partial [Clostridia bacterium]|nr:Ger(x)C family spore germination protein [Clostridia bacterium]
MKRIGLLLMVLLLCFFMTGCWNIREINSLAITICVGIDKTENGYRVTHQILNPKAIASKSPKDEPAVVLYVEEGKDIFEIYRRTTTQSPRKIYNSHMRMVIISEDVAREGLKKILDFFTRDHEFRTDFYFAIAKGVSANRLLSNLTVLESIPGIEMYNSMETSENAWAPVKSIKIVELVNDIIAEGKNPVLTAVELIDEESSATETKALTKSFVKSKPKFTMLGAFNNDKLAGWLNEDESKG